MDIMFYVNGKKHAARNWPTLPIPGDFIELDDGMYQVTYRTLKTNVRKELSADISLIKRQEDPGRGLGS